MKRALGLALVASLLLSGTALAAKYKVELTLDPAAPVYGDSVVFTATGQPGYSFVHVQCYQDGRFVLDAFRGLTDTAYDFGRPLLMANPWNDLWTSGAADCTADVGYWPHGRWRSLLLVDFAVGA